MNTTLLASQTTLASDPQPDHRPLTGRRRTAWEEAEAQAAEVCEHLQGGLDNCHPGFADATERRAYLEDIANAARGPFFGEALAARIERMIGGRL